MKKYLAILALSMLPGLGQAADALHFDFDFETAKLISKAISTNEFDPAVFSSFCASADGKAMIRKMRFKDCDALVLRMKNLRNNNKKVVGAAEQVTSELAKPGYGRYAPLAAEVSNQIKQLVPPDFSANLKVHFIFGSFSGGFAFDDVRDDVYVDLKNFSEATTQELAETVAHELFHAVQSHVMRPESLPTARGPAATTGPVWLNHLLVHLEQEGTAELFTHPIAERPPSPYSAQRKLGIERNAVRIRGLFTMFETLGWRMRLAPPANEDAYDNIYGLMFYTDFDETAYDLGWLMASTIVQKDGKMAIFNLLKAPPKQFVLRYQAIALADGKLPTFSEDFIKEVEALK